MSNPTNVHFRTLTNRTVIGVVVGTAVLLGGCVVRVAQPPPSEAYVASAEEEVQTSEAPPPLPDYEQPPCPEEGYIWTPGYWRWAGGGYYWVPGTWVQPPRVGLYWTPGYWGFVGGVYAFHAGYWGPHVGFYGGVNYGHGYGGVGFVGGRWAGNSFAYNSTVTNVNTTIIHNTYNQTVVNNVTVNKVSYNGGAGGVTAVPTAQERLASQETHIAPTPVQRQHVQEAVKNPALAAKVNGGHPTIAATPRPAAFNAPGIVGAHGAPGIVGAHGAPGVVGAHGAPGVVGAHGAPGVVGAHGAPGIVGAHGAGAMNAGRPPVHAMPPAVNATQPAMGSREPAMGSHGEAMHTPPAGAARPAALVQPSPGNANAPKVSRGRAPPREHERKPENEKSSR